MVAFRLQLCVCVSRAGSNFNFHAPDGSGYKFVADAVLLLDKVNRWQVGAHGGAVVSCLAMPQLYSLGWNHHCAVLYRRACAKERLRCADPRCSRSTLPSRHHCCHPTCRPLSWRQTWWTGRQWSLAAPACCAHSWSGWRPPRASPRR